MVNKNEMELLFQTIGETVIVEMISAKSTNPIIYKGILKKVIPYVMVELRAFSVTEYACMFINVRDGIKRITNEKGEIIYENKELSFLKEDGDLLRDKVYIKKIFEYTNNQRKNKFGEQHAILLKV